MSNDEDQSSGRRVPPRRRRVAAAVAGTFAVTAIVVGLFLVVDRGSDDDTLVSDTVPDVVSTDEPTTAPEVSPVPTDVPATEATDPAPTTTTATTEPDPTTTTTATTTTTPSLESGWRPASEPFPPLAFIACCGADWEGEPSPAVPTDPAMPLPAGIYNVRAVADQANDGFVGGVLQLEVRPYTRCTELGEFECSGDPPYDDGALGVPTDAARTIDVPLDDSIHVGVSGFACEDDRLLADPQVAAGTDLAKLFDDLSASYETAVAEPLRAGVDPAQLAADLAANPTAGFFDSGCPSYPSIAWRPSTGPTILARTLYRLDAASEPEPLPSPALDWAIPTALVVDDGGGHTLYFYAGFLS